MTLQEILKYVNYICVKENSGSTLKPEQFNTILNASNINMFNIKVQEAKASSKGVNFNQALYGHVALREFHISRNITFTSGIFDISILLDTYAYFLSLITLFNGSYKRIEILTDDELVERRTNLMAKQLDDYPGCMILGNIIKVYPTNITTANFTFMKIPATPFFDYYYNSNLSIVYMPQGADHLLGAGEVGSNGETAGTTVLSSTRELEWNTLWHVEFCREILSKVGINLKDEQLRQYVKEAEGKQL